MYPKIISDHADFFIWICKLYFASKIAPNDSYCLYSFPCVILSLECGLVRLMWCQLRGQITKSVVSILGVLIQSFLLALSDKSQGPCCKLLYGKANVARNWGKPPVNRQWRLELFSLTSCKELAPANTHVSKLGNGSSPTWAIGWECSPGGSMTTVSWETWSQPMCTYIIFRYWTQRNSEVVNLCCFKLLSVGVVCYVAIDN